jgi:hypothetical protein
MIVAALYDWLLLGHGAWLVLDSAAWDFGQTWVALALALLVVIAWDTMFKPGL